ncbi:succinate dehydrogenase, hydrophobic membrane anchor protein [Thalassotalea euphylliae]|uniref:Succinate dehydrogenase hydrophobic membrane anchor subunit n=1 Tax=Thalassotalea euphylliae TaxID=1655234 RepID=A0A3E0TIT2_9GAMM|nr:succinate dehydrogenase, hydrophobic membrane anchor protein [Thalassotalea euphylliae]REL24418.1 succinate dehydrogenase, hydrophobic membrane anchor protein [Thalassotalea euphylliae]REL35959.1 succinate dehydrogenase, hydrophobic membrane anchor protein [Thalassotalea euphylliae]
MVNNVATVGRSGVHDFILLRASAVVLAAFVLFIAGFFAFTPEITFEIWHGLFANLAMKVFTLVSLFALLIHAWIGIWQVLSDYIKATFLRGVLQFVFSVTLLTYFVAGFLIVWGV